MVIKNLSSTIIVFNGPPSVSIPPGKVIGGIPDTMRETSEYISLASRGYIIEIQGKEAEQAIAAQVAPKLATAIPPNIRKMGPLALNLSAAQTIDEVPEAPPINATGATKVGSTGVALNPPGAVNEAPTPAVVPQTPTGPEPQADGSLLIKAGRHTTKPAEIVSVKEKKDEGVQINKRVATSPVMTDNETMVMVNPTGIPGQGSLVPMSQMTAEQLASIRAQTNQLLEGVKQDRKQVQLLNTYRDMDVEKRKSFIDNTTDIKAVEVMMQLETSAALKSKLRAKHKRLSQGTADAK